MPTQEQIATLKAQWSNDPCWDIEFTWGFEEHEEELREYREQMEAQWTEERQAKIQAKAADLNCSLDLAEYILLLEYRLERVMMAIEGMKSLIQR